MTLPLLIVLSTTPWAVPVNAQELATVGTQLKKQDTSVDLPQQDLKGMQSLKEVLSELEEQYQISIVGESYLLHDKFVKKDQLVNNDNADVTYLEELLKNILQPLGLEYKRYGNSFVIQSVTEDKKFIKRVEGKRIESQIQGANVGDQQKVYRLPRLPARRSLVALFMEKTITGKIMDENNEPLPGVNIVLKGTTTGTITDIDGNYRLTVPDDAATLVFSSVGYETEEINIGNQTVIDIQMTPDVQALSEIVVVGFGEKRKKDLTGSISTVNADAIEKVGMSSPQFALQGNTTGVRVVNASGDPNEAPQIFVRGVGTWNGDSQPLYVIDGQIIEPPRAGNEDVISGHGLSTPPNLFNLINPNDIESISVLKDASAAAVYGSRAANGVVLITTKKGKTGAPVIELNTRTGIQNIPTYDLLNTEQFVGLAREMYSNSTNPDTDINEDLYGRNEASDAVRLTNFNPQFDPESPYYISDRTTYDWQDELVRNNALNQAYDVKVSGGTDRVDYYVSAGLYNQEGMIYGNELTRYTGAVNLNVNVTDWLKIGVNYKYTHQESELNVAELQDIADVSPWQPLRDPTNEFGFAPVLDPYRFGDTWQGIKIYGQGSNTNFLALTDLNFRSFDIGRNLGQFYAEIEPIPGLTLRGSLNLDYTQQDRFGLDAFSRVNIFQPTAIDPREEAANAPNSLASMSHRINNIFNFQSDFTATYSKIFAQKHNMSITAAVQDQRHRRETLDISGQNLTNLTDNPRNNGFGADLSNNNGFYGWNQRFWFGMVGRGSYNYDSKYYLDISFRRDASNGFDDDYRWGNFYSASGAWRISSENFFNVPLVNDLKIRGGWGEAGNDQAAVGSYAFLSGVSGGLSSYRWGSGNGDPIGIQSFGALVADFPNPQLSWEIATTTYVGFDALLFNNKLNMTFEWYNRVTSGILQTVNLPYSVGTNNPLFNIGEMENRGVDLMLSYGDQIGEFTYNISGNISFVQNEVTKLYQGQPLFISGLFERPDADVARIEEGRSVGVIWGYRHGGIFQTQQEIDQYFSEYEDSNVSNEDFVEPGDMYFVDVYGNPTEAEPFYSETPDGQINDFDRTDIGNTIPGYTYGINLNLGWKGLDLSMNFYGEGDVEKFNAARLRFESMSGAGTNYFTTTLNRWTPSNMDTDMPRAVVGDPAANNRFSSRWVESAAFFRLNNWQLGYTLPASVLELVNNTVKSLRIYVGGQNNIYMFKWSGIDPVNDAFPLPKTFNAGLNVRF